MPVKDGTGPTGQGPIIRDMANESGGGGKMGGLGIGPNGDCVCHKCGAKVAHQAGVPCTSVICPKCNTIMTRE